MAIKDDIYAYCRVDSNDTTLDAIIESATAYIEEATGKELDMEMAVHAIAVKMLSAHWYDNRGVMTPYTVSIPFSVETLINHIKLAGD